MSFQPVVPLSGLAGYGFLARTLDRQMESFSASPERARETARFAERIGSVKSAEELVADRRLLAVALGAFGLEADIDNRFFVRKVLEEGTVARDALANRLADKRYRAFAEAFGFGNPGGARTAEPGFAARISAAFERRSFEAAVGNSDATLRLALNARRELPALAARAAAPDTLFFELLGSPPLREVFETAFALPSGFGGLDLDRQVEVLRERSQRAFGDGELTQFTDPAKLDELLRRFLLQSEVQSGPGPGTPGLVALSLLQGAAAPGTATGASVFAALA